MRPVTFIAVATLLACPMRSKENERCQRDPDCTSGLSCCNGACIDVAKDIRHCGACGTACGDQNAAAACVAGQCKVSCTEGFGDCNQLTADGCEVNVRADVTNCGSCGTACLVSNATPTCSMAGCGVQQCNQGFANCDGRGQNGCEVVTSEDLSNCGACGVTCQVANGTPRCLGSRCTVGVCQTNFGDCDGRVETGCETDVQTSAMHCGQCGRACTGDETCAQGTCQVFELFLVGGMPAPNMSASNVVNRLQLGQRSFIEVGTPGVLEARAFHVAAYDAQATRVLVLGGSNGAGTAVAEGLYAFDVSAPTPTWRAVATSGPGPDAATGMSAGWDEANRRWYVFGGSSQAFSGTPKGILRVLDVETLTWREPSVLNPPPARSFAAGAFDQTSGRFVMHGGLDSSGMYLAETWVYDPGAATWTQVMTSGPGPRVGATFFPGASPPVLFGGVDARVQTFLHFDDVWELDVENLAWTRREAPMGPTARRNSMGVSLAGVRYLVSGVYDDGRTEVQLFNDVWSLSWPSRVWQQVRSNSITGTANQRFGAAVVGRARP